MYIFSFWNSAQIQVFHSANSHPSDGVKNGASPHVRGEVHLAGVAGHHVALEDLLLVQTEAVLGPKDQDLVVHGLARQPFTWRRRATREV